MEFANPAYTKLAGREDLVGQTIRAAFPDIEGQGFFELLDQVFRSGEARSIFSAPIVFHEKPDGPARERLIDFVYQPIRDADGRVGGIFVQGSDVTDRALAEAARRDSEAQLSEIAAINQSEAQFRLLVKGVTDYAIYMLDPEGVVSSWNPGAQRIKGYARGNHRPAFFDLLHGGGSRRRGAATRLETARRDGRFETEGWRVRKDGTQFWAHVVIDAIPRDDGRLGGIRQDHAGHHRTPGNPGSASSRPARRCSSRRRWRRSAS